MSSSAEESDEPETTPETTKDIVRRARERPGDFRELYERIAPSLLAWSRLKLGPSGAVDGDPEDLLQEVWVRALAEFPRYDAGHSSFRAWIFGIAKNVMYEMWRHTARRTAPPRSAQDSAALEEWPDVATTIRTRLSRAESMDVLLQRVEQFDPLDRKLLLHCGFEEMSCPNAARQLGIEESAARKRWQRLRTKLADGGFGNFVEMQLLD
jgi:RNA polymerase sigma-70 factor (ECF subfamily)